MQFSVKGNSVTLLADGKQIGTEKLQRGQTPLTPEGTLLIGSQYTPQSFFEVYCLHYLHQYVTVR